MYIPKHFEVTDESEVFRFINANAFGQLISTINGRPFATHMPFLLSEDKKQLIGHVALQNPQQFDIANQEVLVTLQGEHAYISPSWYEGRGVPTWNYQAVHVYGKALVFTDQEKLQTVVDTLTSIFEAHFEQPWQPDYSNAMIKAIVGIEIEITEIQAKYKLSQNRTEQDRTQVIQRLAATGANEVANAMAIELER